MEIVLSCFDSIGGLSMPVGPVSSRLKCPDFYMNDYMEMPESGRRGGALPTHLVVAGPLVLSGLERTALIEIHEQPK